VKTVQFEVDWAGIKGAMASVRVERMRGASWEVRVLMCGLV